MERWEKPSVRLAVMGDLMLGLLAQLSPMSLFRGEFQINRIINSPVSLLKVPPSPARHRRYSGGYIRLLGNTVTHSMLAFHFDELRHQVRVPMDAKDISRGLPANHARHKRVAPETQ